MYVFLVMHREEEMGAKLIVEMDGKKTRIQKPKLTTIDNNNAIVNSRDNYNDFTFDHSYWSFEGANDGSNGNNPHIVTQEEVYSDLGTDVINCAFEGEHPRFYSRTIFILLQFIPKHNLYYRYVDMCDSVSPLWSIEKVK